MIELRFQINQSEIDQFKKDASQFDIALDKAIEAAAVLIRNEAVKNISHGSRTGRLYRRRGVVHQASAQGEFPKSDTGRLASTSIRVNHNFLKAEVGSDLMYAGYLETKAPDNGGRPWLERSYDLVKDSIDPLIQNAMKKVFKI